MRRKESGEDQAPDNRQPTADNRKRRAEKGNEKKALFFTGETCNAGGKWRTFGTPCPVPGDRIQHNREKHPKKGKKYTAKKKR